MDVPLFNSLRMHLPKLVLWAAMEAVVVASMVYRVSDAGTLGRLGPAALAPALQARRGTASGGAEACPRLPAPARLPLPPPVCPSEPPRPLAAPAAPAAPAVQLDNDQALQADQADCRDQDYVCDQGAATKTLDIIQVCVRRRRRR